MAKMGIIIKSVTKGSAAYKAGIKSGDELISIDGHIIHDVLDYMYYCAQAKLTLELSDRSIGITKGEYDDLGLEFDSFLMDDSRRCCNNCIFCFIDQMPKGMRDTLYFKDDDARLSFLQGNYITLTNLSEKEVQRIIEMKLSVNVSVHTTNPELRVKMMGNRFAGKALDHLHTMAKAGIMLNCQLVLCKGINDGEELRRSISDLTQYPSVQSIACVPVGLSKHRTGLYPLEPYDSVSANEVIDIIESCHAKLMDERGSKIVYPADEFFLLANKDLPNVDYYEEFPQYENGVGITTLFKSEFLQAVEEIAPDDKKRSVSIATGVAAGRIIADLIEIAKEKWHNLRCEVFSIENDFFGHGVTVAGLVTGQDMLAQLKGKDLGDKLLIPSVMLRSGTEIFLDDMTVPQLQEQLGVEIITTNGDGNELLEAILK